MEFIQSTIAESFGFPDDEVMKSLREVLTKLRVRFFYISFLDYMTRFVIAERWACITTTPRAGSTFRGLTPAEFSFFLHF